MDIKLTPYDSPEVKVVDMLAEGVLCSSGSSLENWQDGDSLVDWE